MRPGAGVSGRGPTIWDAIVVGAGPGGAIAAHALAGRGASVLLVERAAVPRWKVCGACLSPGALQALDAAGVRGRVDTLGPVRLAWLELATSGARARVRLAGSVALSRSALDDALVRAAVERGVRFVDRTRATVGACDGSVRVVRTIGPNGPGTHAGRVVIDAAGLAGASGRTEPDGAAAITEAPRSRVGIGATLDASGSDPSPGVLRMVVGSVGYVGMVRQEDGRLNVAAAVDRAALREGGPAGVVSSILREAGVPEPRGSAVHGWRGTPTLTRRPADVGAERLLRLGDAAGYVEPFTGEGICWALDAGLEVAGLAERAADGWGDDVLAEWRAYHRRLRRAQRLCHALARGLRRPGLTSLVVGVLRSAPGLASPFVRGAAARPSRRTA